MRGTDPKPKLRVRFVPPLDDWRRNFETMICTFLRHLTEYFRPTEKKMCLSTNILVISNYIIIHKNYEESIHSGIMGLDWTGRESI